MTQNKPDENDNSKEADKFADRPVTFTAVVTRIRHKNVNDGYHILEVRWQGKTGDCKGKGHRFIEGMTYKFTGTKKYDHVRKNFYVQFDEAQEIIDATETGLVAYLATECPTVAEVAANALVKKYGKGVIEVLKNPEKLSQENTGFSIERATTIANWANGEVSNADIKRQLYGIGLSHGLVIRLLAAYGRDAKDKIKKNCFKLIELDGFGYMTVSMIADLVGIPANDPGRIRCALMHVMSEQANQCGHVCLPESVLLGQACDLLKIPQQFVTEQIEQLINLGKLVDGSAKATELGEELAEFTADDASYRPLETIE